MKDLSLATQLKVIAGAALLLFVILIFGVVLPNSDDLGPGHLEDASINGTSVPLYTNTSLVILSNSTDPLNEERRDFVRSLANRTWTSYIQYAKSILDSQKEEESFLTEHTLAVSLSTLWILDLKDQFNQTWHLFQKNYFGTNLFWKSEEIHVQRMVTEVIGSMLSCYALTEDDSFLETAKSIAERLTRAYDNRTGISYSHLPNGDNTESIATLSEIGGQFLEYIYLASILKNNQLLDSRVYPMLSHLNSSKHIEGFYSDRLFVPTAIWASNTMTLYSSTSAYYQSLLKAYIQSNRTNIDLLDLYIDAIESLESLHNSSLVGLSKTGLKFTREYNHQARHLINADCMKADGCYLGSMFALGAAELRRFAIPPPELTTETNIEIEVDTEEADDKRADRWMQLAEDLTETCYQASIRSEDKLLPKKFCFNDQNEATYKSDIEEWEEKGTGNDLRPDLAESYFTLWRLTENEQYRRQAWKLAQAIGKYLQNSDLRHSVSSEDTSGYSPASSLSEASHPPAHFLGSTLKYLFLIFSETTTFPLDEWIFNSAGQPIPISHSEPESLN